MKKRSLDVFQIPDGLLLLPDDQDSATYRIESPPALKNNGVLQYDSHQPGKSVEISSSRVPINYLRYVPQLLLYVENGDGGIHFNENLTPK